MVGFPPFYNQIRLARNPFWNDGIGGGGLEKACTKNTTEAAVGTWQDGYVTPAMTRMCSEDRQGTEEEGEGVIL